MCMNNSFTGNTVVIFCSGKKKALFIKSKSFRLNNLVKILNIFSTSFYFNRRMSIVAVHKPGRRLSLIGESFSMKLLTLPLGKLVKTESEESHDA